MDSLGGYRLVRLLGTGSRANVWLGHGAARHNGEMGHNDEGGHNGEADDSGGELAAVKVFHAGTAQSEIDTEIEALARTSHRHLVRLDDLATAPDGLPSLILQRLSSVSLSDLLSRRALQTGEAVTVLAPLALAVAELHRVGVAHGRIRASAVLFDTDGAPVLARLGAANIVGDIPASGTDVPLVARLAAEPGVVSDLTQLAALCRATLGDSAEELSDILPSNTQDSDHFDDPQTWLQQLADRLFAVAAAEPVRFDTRQATRVPGRVPGRLPDQPPGHRPEHMTVGPSAREHAPELGEAGTSLGDPTAKIPGGGIGMIADQVSWVLEAGLVASLRAGVSQILKSVRGSVRRPVWIAAGAVAVALVGTTILFASADPHTPSPSNDPSAAIESTPMQSTPVVDISISGEDPIAAATALLAARAECVRATSVLCLDGVDQRASAAIDADTYRIRVEQQGGVQSPEPSLDNVETIVLDELGDGTLLALKREGTTVATLLLVRTDQGWRIRDLIFVTT